MKRALLLAAVAAVLASPAFAAGVKGCSTAPQAQWQPQSKLTDMLKADGMTVKQIKIEKGCYEVYATDKAGARANLAYNAETLEKLDNAEAGEN